jgi:hypothetical protein
MLCAWQAGAIPMPPHLISAANINVVQNDSGNSTNSVTVTNTLSINDMRIRDGSNRGDYNLQVGDTPGDDLTIGLVMTAVTENGRDNLEGTGINYMASAFDATPNFGTNEFVSGYWLVMGDCTTSRAEYNANCAVAFFRYSDWLCGWARNATGANGGTNNFFTASPGLVLGTHFKGVSAGRSLVDLREFGYSNTNGVLIVNHAKNEGNFGLSQANADGTWTLYVKDNNANASSYEQDPVAFVFIPSTNTTVISGRFGCDDTGVNAPILTYSGPTSQFAITNIDVGRWRLTIPGYTPATGVLIVSAEGGLPINQDNVVSYQADGDGWIIESRDNVAGESYPVLETPVNEPVASFVFIPAATPGFTVNPTNGLNTSESGGTAAFAVVLDVPPTDEVTIALASDNASEGTVAPASLTFTTNNWNLSQTVTVSGQDDSLVDGQVNYTIVLSPAASMDSSYNGIDPMDVTLVNADNDQAGITVSPMSGLITTEAGGTAVFSIRLNSQPAGNVTIGLSSGTPAEGFVSPASLTFTPVNWNTNQTASITGVDDAFDDGDIAYTILTAPATSADLGYSGLKAADVSAMNQDNDAIVIFLTAGTDNQIAAREGGTTNFSFVLGSQPAADVVLTFNSANTSKGTVSPTSVTFTTSDWNVAKTVTLTGLDNAILDGDFHYTISSSVSSADASYAALTIPNILATTLDNEAALVLPDGDCIYGLGMPAIVIDGRATLADLDTSTYSDGSLVLTLANNASPNDRLEIRNAGGGPGQISVAGNDVSYEGNVIGSLAGGSGTTPLVVSLNTNATVVAARALIRAITFRTAANENALATRGFVVTLNDGLGGASTASKAIRVGHLRLAQFQEGADHGYGDYLGTADIALSEAAPITPWPIGRNVTEGLLLDWPDVGTPNSSQILMRFDNYVGTNFWQIPTGAVVVAAELFVNVNNTGNGGILYRMLVPWDGTNETWDSLGGGVQQDGVESEVNYESQWNVQAGTGATGNGIVSIGVTPDIQAWVNGTNNYGWVMTGWPFNTDGTGLSPSEASDINLRPRLRVLWLPPGEGTLVTFRQGVNDYANAFDTRIRANAPDTNYSEIASVFVDYAVSGTSDEEQVLLRFDELIGSGTNQIPQGARIDAAILDLGSVGSNATGDGGHLHSLLQPWDATTTTWNTWGGDGIQPDGLEAASAPTATAGTPLLDPNVQGGFNSFEVTSDVQDWANGTDNNGWVWLPWTGGPDGWGFATSEAATERERPRLRVYYAVAAANVSAAVLQPLSIGLTQIQVRFTGTVGKTYIVLRAAGAAGPWTSIGAAAVDGTGSANLIDSAPLPNAAFYRVVFP